LIVEPAQREAREALVRARSTSQQLALRARMILHAADNIGVRESARELDVRAEIKNKHMVVPAVDHLL
jgi:hypothetical protein